MDKNWEVVRDRCKKVLKGWKGERLSMAGKVVVINNLVIPKINYVMGTLELSNNHRKSIENEMAKFFVGRWSRGRS